MNVKKERDARHEEEEDRLAHYLALLRNGKFGINKFTFLVRERERAR